MFYKPGLEILDKYAGSQYYLLLQHQNDLELIKCSVLLVITKIENATENATEYVSETIIIKLSLIKHHAIM